MEKEFGFSKNERLCRKSVIDRVFEKGEDFFSYPLKCVYLIEESACEDGPPVSVLFSVGKRNHKHAVRRNLIKRRMRESYRRWKGLLSQAINACENDREGQPRSTGPDQNGRRFPKKVYICFIYTSKTAESYQVIENGIKKALIRIRENHFKRNDNPADPVDKML